jgi:hypothetical protein
LDKHEWDNTASWTLEEMKMNFCWCNRDRCHLPSLPASSCPPLGLGCSLPPTRPALHLSPHSRPSLDPTRTDHANPQCSRPKPEPASPSLHSSNSIWNSFRAIFFLLTSLVDQLLLSKTSQLESLTSQC